MRTYPENIEELVKKHSFSFPIDSDMLESIRENIILRHDIAFVFLKFRVLNSLKKENLFENELYSDSFLDKKFNQTDRLKIYKAIKNQFPLPVSKRRNLYSLFHLNEKPKIDTRVLTIKELICNLIKQNKINLRDKFEIIFKNELETYRNKQPKH